MSHFDRSALKFGPILENMYCMSVALGGLQLPIPTAEQSYKTAVNRILKHILPATSKQERLVPGYIRSRWCFSHTLHESYYFKDRERRTYVYITWKFASCRCPHQNTQQPPVRHIQLHAPNPTCACQRSLALWIRPSRKGPRQRNTRIQTPILVTSPMPHPSQTRLR